MPDLPVSHYRTMGGKGVHGMAHTVTHRRKRHIKCDETKPSCQKCATAGWKCDGYESRPASVASTSPPASALSIGSYAIPFRIPGSQKDRQILHYFCVQASRDIAGFLDSEFWSRTVLEASHHDTAVRHALVSLSVLHLNYVTASDHSTVSRSDIIAQYGKALRALGKRVEEATVDSTRVALICCILFYCFESTLGNSDAAMHHLQGGLRLLSQHRQSCGNRDSEGITALTRVFERLDLQATMFDDGRVPYLDLTPVSIPEELADRPFDNVVFSRLEDACDSLVTLQNRLFHFLTKNLHLKTFEEEFIPAVILMEKQDLQDQFDKWKADFDKFAHHSDRCSRGNCGIPTLLIQWRVSHMLLEAEYPFNWSVFGAGPNPDAEEIISLARSVLKLTSERNASMGATTTLRRNFSSETGIIAPLFILAMKCSDRTVCDRATELLSMTQRREGLYDSESMAAIVRRFTAAKAQRSLDDGIIREGTNMPLETLFAEELDKTMGGMDRRADYVQQTLSTSFT